MMQVERSVVKECKRKTHFVVIDAEFNVPGTTNYSGVVTLTRRLENIIAFQVKVFSIQGVVYSNPAKAYQHLTKLSSSRLGSMLIANPFQIATSVNSNIQTSIPNSNVIAVTDAMADENFASQIKYEYTCPKMLFAKPTDIDRFDWLIEPISYTITNNAFTAFAEIVIEFFPACDC